jgi:hypothetical protein
MFWRRRKEVPGRGSTPRVVAPSNTTPLVLYVSSSAVRDTFEYLSPYCRSGVETAAFWFGIEVGQVQVVTTVVAPRLLQTSGNYRVDRGSLRRMARELGRQELTNLAQVHTHPGEWVGHSPYDDENAYSTRDGALSLVWPSYGATLNRSLLGVGVHERRGDRWVRLKHPEHISERVRIVDAFADFRWEITDGGIEDVE